MSGGGGLMQRWWIHLGPLAVSETVVITWALMLALCLVAWLLARRPRTDPGQLQAATEGVYGAVRQAVADVLPDYADRVMPFVGTLWIFLVAANLIGIVPGLESPTSDMATPAALAVLVFASVHWFGIRTQGLRRYLAHYLEPNPLLLPFNVIGEITRSVALTFRLFGNMVSLSLTALLVLMVAGFLAPIPILMLHIVEALVQAYIFGMLALIYIAGGIQAQESRGRDEE